MSDLLTVHEVAALLGIAPESVRSTLRRYGIAEVRGYPRGAVDAIQRPGRGARTDLRKDATMPTVTLTVDATPGAVQDVARQVFGCVVGVGGGRYAEVSLPADAADRLAVELREHGYEVWS